jgi:hypothetical protein
MANAGLQVINGTVVNPSTTITALTPNAGDSYTVRNAAAGSDVELLQAWAFTTTNLLFRVRSPLMHDQAQNIRMQPTASQPYPLLSGALTQKLFPQDNMTVELTGGTAETDIGSLLVYYNNLPGISARLHSEAEVMPLIQNLTTVEVDVTSSGTAGAYSATVPLNGTFDTLRRNIDYAVLGYECATTGCSLGITGVDTGNLRVGGPLTNLAFVTKNWFVDLSNMTGKSCIPVINSANVAGVNIDVVAQATSTVFKVGIHLAQLSSPSGLS